MFLGSVLLGIKKGAGVNGRGASRPDFFVSNRRGKRYSVYKVPKGMIFVFLQFGYFLNFNS